MIEKTSDTARGNRDLLIMLQTKLDQIESLVEGIRYEYKVDHDDMIYRMDNLAKDMQNENEKNRTKIDEDIYRLESKLVSKEVFQPVKSIVYGLAGTIIIGVLYAVLKSINIGKINV